jgi:hypothetical protein
MPTGIPAKSAHSALVEPWRERTQKQTLLDASRRLRERVEETERVDNARDGQIRSAVRRCICDAENLIGLAERLLRADWIER